MVGSSSYTGDIYRPYVYQKKRLEVMERVAALGTYYATSLRLSHFATRQSGRNYVDFSKLKVVGVSASFATLHTLVYPCVS